MKTIAFLLSALAASPAQTSIFQDMWVADCCDAVHEALSFDTADTDKSPAEYAEGLAVMASAYGFLHGYAVANGWHEVDGFDYVQEFRETCEEFPARPPIKILIHLF